MLVNLVPTPSPASVVALYHRFKAQLPSIYRRSYEPATSLEDDLHDAMVLFLTVLPSFDPRRGEVGPWAWGVARNATRDRMRARRRHAKYFEPEDALGGTEPVDVRANPVRQAELQQAMQRVFALLDKMPEPKRTVLWLVSMEGLSHAEIGAQLGISENAAKQTYYRARLWLLRNLDASTDDLLSATPPLAQRAHERRAKARWRRWFERASRGSLFASTLLAAALAAPQFQIFPAWRMPPTAIMTLAISRAGQIAVPHEPAGKPTSGPPSASLSAQPAKGRGAVKPRLEFIELAYEFAPDGARGAVGPGKKCLPGESPIK